MHVFTASFGCVYACMHVSAYMYIYIHTQLPVGRKRERESEIKTKKQGTKQNTTHTHTHTHLLAPACSPGSRPCFYRDFVAGGISWLRGCD